MDLFKYKAAVKEIELTTTVGGLERLVRNYQTHVQSSDLRSLYGKPSFKTPIESQIYYYKLLTYSIKRFAEKSSKELPNFIHSTKNIAHEKLLHGICNYANKEDKYKTLGLDLITYEQFMDWFEFDDLINLPNSTHYVEVLNQIIDDKPVHFKVKWNYKLTQFDCYSTELLYDAQVLAYAIRYQQVHLADKPKQTIWDSFLEYYKEQAQHNFGTTLDSDITNLTQHLRALNTLKDNYEQ